MTRVWMMAVAFSVVASSASAQVEVEPLPDEFRVTAAEGRRTATAGGRGFCAASAEPFQAREVRAQVLRDVLDLRQTLAGRATFNLKGVADDLKKVARLACAHGSDANTSAWLVAYRQLLINVLDIDDASLDALLGAALASEGRRAAPDCSALEPSPSDHRVERWRKEMFRAMCSLEARPQPEHTLLYWYDRFAGPNAPVSTTPMLERAGFIDSLLGPRARTVTTSADVLGQKNLLRYVLIKQDVETFDLAAALRELDTFRLPAASRAWTVAYLHRVRATARRFVSDVERASAGDRTVAAFVGEHRVAAERAYAADVAAHTDALRRAYAIEDAWITQNRAVLSSCAAPARDAFFAYVRSNQPRTQEAIDALFGRPAGYVLASAWARCEAEAGHAGVATHLSRLLGQRTQQRGPHTAILQELSRRAVEVGGDAVQTRAFTALREPESDENWIADVGSANSDSQGVVAAAERRGDVVRVSFRRETVRVATYACTPSNRISRIDMDGEVHYSQDCVVNGHRDIQVQAEPCDIPASLADSVRAGVYAEILRGMGNDTAGILVVVRQRPDGELTTYLGLAVSGR